MPDITINGNTYTCDSAHIEQGELTWGFASIRPVREYSEITLSNVTHINGERMPVEGGQVTLQTGAHISLSEEEDA